MISINKVWIDSKKKLLDFLKDKYISRAVVNIKDSRVTLYSSFEEYYAVLENVTITDVLEVLDKYFYDKTLRSLKDYLLYQNIDLNKVKFEVIKTEFKESAAEAYDISAEYSENDHLIVFVVPFKHFYKNRNEYEYIYFNEEPLSFRKR